MEVDIAIQVLDESGDGVPGAQVAIGDRTTTSDEAGIAIVSIDSPVVATIRTDRTLPEPVAIAPRDRAVEVRLWNRTGPDGRERTSLHFGGDVMLGRRYLDPELSTPFVEDAESARRIVADLAPLTSSADWTSVNLETVVGNLPADDALPAKRFLLQSSPLVAEALDEMGVDLVTLGNNHAYDWGEAGIESTVSVLDTASILHVGAGTSPDEAVRGRIAQVGAVAIGVVSVTTVTGDFVNDRLPEVDEPVPADLSPNQRWQYELRPFGFRSPDERLTIASRPMRISEVWDIVGGAESSDRFEHADELWAAATATFPELQDWVARRGHGGAARYQSERVDDEISRLRTGGADFIVVQVHGGFQFAEVNSSFIRNVARRSIDAGADAVIAHHPHVLQGVEWYEDKLIVYSLGNLVFDQQLLSTFPSAVLRVITEGDRTLEARLMPVILDRYRPVPVVGDAAQEIIRLIDARTAQPATSSRIGGLAVGSVLDAPANRRIVDTDTSAAPGEFDRSASVVFERNSGLILRNRSSQTVSLDTSGRLGAWLPACAITRTDVLDPQTRIGIDLFDWGDFDRSTAQVRPTRFPVNWLVSKDSRRWAYGIGSTGEDFDRAFTLFSDTDSVTTVRIGGRFDTHAHRLFDSGGRPLDASATYQLVLDAKRVRGETPIVRMVSYISDETDSSTRLREIEFPVPVPDDDRWHRLAIPVSDALFAPDENGAVPDAATMLIDTPPALRGELTIDNVMFIEWRGSTESEVATWVEGDIVRSSNDAVVLEMSGC